MLTTSLSRSALLFAAIASPLLAQSPKIYDNGPLNTAPGAGSGGADLSVLQNATLSMTILGYGANFAAASAQTMADDFVVCDPAGWTVDAVEAFAYQTGSPTTSTITGLHVEIYDGDPNAGGVPVAGSPGIANNLLTAGQIANEWTNIYRVAETSQTSTLRPIMRVVASLPAPITLAPGTYWIQFGFTGSLASGPWAPPIAVDDRGDTGNGQQQLGTTWSSVTSGAFGQGLPFALYGTRADAQGSFAPGVVTSGCSAASLRVAGSPVIGGFFYADIENPTPASFSWIGASFTSFAVPQPIPGCACELANPFDVFEFENLGLTVPADPILCGTDVFLQGLEYDVPLGCILPIALTDSVKVTLR